MTIDERLEKLTERHEALTRSVEMHDHQLAKLEQLVTSVAEGTARLLRIVEMHEHRLDSHDQRLDNLENQ